MRRRIDMHTGNRFRCWGRASKDYKEKRFTALDAVQTHYLQMHPPEIPPRAVPRPCRQIPWLTDRGPKYCCEQIWLRFQAPGSFPAR